MVFGVPFTTALTLLILGFHVLLVFLWEWDTLLPNTTPFPQTLHFAMTATPPVLNFFAPPAVLTGGMQTYKPSESDTSVIVSQILGEIKSFFYIFQKIRFVGRKIGKFPQKPDVRGRGKEKPTGKIAEKVLRRQ